MQNFDVDVQVLYRNDEPWADTKVTLYIKWPSPIPGGGGYHVMLAWTNDDGHAEFTVDDEYDSLDGDTEIEIRVQCYGDDYDFGPYDLGQSAFTVNIDLDPEGEAEEENEASDD